ncbi:MAG: quinone oxidoreductase [Alphaproteobacteria bacterium]
MTKAVRIHEPGGPEALVFEDVDVGEPGPGEARVRHSAVGLNFIDIYHRNGAYPLERLPAVLGMEAAGVVEAVGAGVAEVGAGDRVAYATPPPGAYAQARVMAADRLVRLPDDIDDRTAAAMMLKGMTAQYLLRRTHKVEPGETVLIHAAAGGMGLILCQWAKHLGALVMGTVSSDEKAARAGAHGCDHAIVYTRRDFVEAVREITGGDGAQVIYDGVGRATFDESLEALAMRGHLVSYGSASGPVPPFDMARLSAKSATLTRPVLFHYTAARDELEETARELFEVVRRGIVKIEIDQTHALEDAAAAHRELEARRTTGSTVLIP